MMALAYQWWQRASASTATHLAHRASWPKLAASSKPRASRFNLSRNLNCCVSPGRDTVDALELEERPDASIEVRDGHAGVPCAGCQRVYAAVSVTRRRGEAVWQGQPVLRAQRVNQ